MLGRESVRLGYRWEGLQTQTLSGPRKYSAGVHLLAHEIRIVSMKVSYS